jgi:hypothetical protein
VRGRAENSATIASMYGRAWLRNSSKLRADRRRKLVRNRLKAASLVHDREQHLHEAARRP